MKKVILGCTLFLAGVLTAALLTAAAITLGWSISRDGGEAVHSVLWTLSRYRLTPVLGAALAAAAGGLGLAVWGTLEKR